VNYMKKVRKNKESTFGDAVTKKAEESTNRVLWASPMEKESGKTAPREPQTGIQLNCNSNAGGIPKRKKNRKTNAGYTKVLRENRKQGKQFEPRQKGTQEGRVC